MTFWESFSSYFYPKLNPIHLSRWKSIMSTVHLQAICSTSAITNRFLGNWFPHKDRGGASNPTHIKTAIGTTNIGRFSRNGELKSDAGRFLYCGKDTVWAFCLFEWQNNSGLLKHGQHGVEVSEILVYYFVECYNVCRYTPVRISRYGPKSASIIC